MKFLCRILCHRWRFTRGWIIEWDCEALFYRCLRCGDVS